MSSEGQNGSTCDVEIIASSIVERLTKDGLTARVFGGAGVLLTTRYAAVLGNLRVTRDIDLVAKACDHRDVWEWLVADDWVPEQYETFRGRSLKSSLTHPYNAVKVDLFSDPLYFSQRIDLAGRLYLQSPTLSIADLLLTKLQAEAFTLTDLHDVLAILGTWPVSENDKDGISARRISAACARNWGLYYSCSRKLRAIAGIDELEYARPAKFDALIRQRAVELITAITKTHKSLYWRIRDWVGPRVKWYLDVE
jgi:hypothetical protein